MSKVKYIVCDICNMAITDRANTLSIRDVGSMSLFGGVVKYISKGDVEGFGWCWKRIHICRACLENIRKMRREKRKGE